MKSKRIVIDLDGTICEELPTFDKFLSKPKPFAKQIIDNLYEKYFIVIYTARGWAEFNITEKWLKENDIKYDLLMCGKPIYDFWIDDRALMFQNDWNHIKKIIDEKRSI